MASPYQKKNLAALFKQDLLQKKEKNPPFFGKG